MPVSEMVKARKCGQIRFHAIYQYPSDLNRILQMCQLKAVADNLLTIHRNDAVHVLTCWLHRDAAYKTELMNAELARDLAEQFVNSFADQSSRFFTNGPWHNSGLPQSWEPLTDSMFDGGVIIEAGAGNDSRHFCLWFEDED